MCECESCLHACLCTRAHYQQGELQRLRSGRIGADCPGQGLPESRASCASCCVVHIIPSCSVLDVISHLLLVVVWLAILHHNLVMLHVMLQQLNQRLWIFSCSLPRRCGHGVVVCLECRCVAAGVTILLRIPSTWSSRPSRSQSSKFLFPQFLCLPCALFFPVSRRRVTAPIVLVQGCVCH